MLTGCSLWIASLDGGGLEFDVRCSLGLNGDWLVNASLTSLAPYQPQPQAILSLRLHSPATWCHFFNTEKFLLQSLLISSTINDPISIPSIQLRSVAGISVSWSMFACVNATNSTHGLLFTPVRASARSGKRRLPDLNFDSFHFRSTVYRLFWTYACANASYVFSMPFSLDFERFNT
jgi:hypothetical protein